MNELRYLRSASFATFWLYFATLGTGHTAYAEDPIPDIISIKVSTSNVNLAVSNIATGGTYYVEYSADLAATNQMEIYAFEGDPSITNWSGGVSESTASGFYRMVRETYHPKVGAIATFGDIGPLYHNVSGTAHIINNRTIELRNFNYDGGGLDVQMYLSPNTSFSPYIAISDQLLGTSYNNATLQLPIPEGTDLNTYTNISVWCVDVSVSFGTGVFQ